jgi:hypothetical protein
VGKDKALHELFKKMGDRILGIAMIQIKEGTGLPV